MRKLHGWDPFNVTEESDLGTRLGAKGYSVGIVDSATFEDDRGSVEEWIHQRARWIKGYMQTLLAHARHPRQLTRSIGVPGLLGFAFMIGGTVLSVTLNPLLWVLAFSSLLALSLGAGSLLPGILLPLTLSNLVAGSLALLFPRIVAIKQRSWPDLAAAGLATLAYWPMIASAAFWALWQLLAPVFTPAAARLRTSGQLDDAVAPTRGAWS